MYLIVNEKCWSPWTWINYIKNNLLSWFICTFITYKKTFNLYHVYGYKFYSLYIFFILDLRMKNYNILKSIGVSVDLWRFNCVQITERAQWAVSHEKPMSIHGDYSLHNSKYCRFTYFIHSISSFFKLLFKLPC